MDYDIIIIGAGPGGYEMALEAANRYKMKTALIEKRELGGTCLNRGCIPTKTFLHTAELYDEVKDKGEVFGFEGYESLFVDMSRLQRRKEDVTGTLRDGVAKLLKAAKVDIFEGIGSIVDVGQVKVKATYSTIELKGKHIVIATGSKPDRQEELAGHDLSGVVTSDEILDLDRVPESLVILGGGVIGMELASVFNSLGSHVTVLKASSQIFNNLDKELGQGLKMIMKKRGVEIISGVKVTAIEKKGNLLTCSYEKTDDKEHDAESLSCEMVLLAKGRKPETAEIIDDSAVERIKSLVLDERGRIVVDEHFKTSVDGIYAIGDCINGKKLPGHAQLAHVATAEGKNLLSYLNDEPEAANLSVIPSCIYTSPEIAAVGISAEDCKEQGIDIIIKKLPMGGNAKTVLTGQERSFIKVIAQAGTNKIIGASLMCARATDMISIFSQAIVKGMPLDDVAGVIFPHPTFSEAVGDVCR